MGGFSSSPVLPTAFFSPPALTAAAMNAQVYSQDANESTFLGPPATLRLFLRQEISGPLTAGLAQMEQRLTALIHQSLNQQSNLPTIDTVRNLIDAQTNHILARLDEQKTTLETKIEAERVLLAHQLDAHNEATLPVSDMAPPPATGQQDPIGERAVLRDDSRQPVLSRSTRETSGNKLYITNFFATLHLKRLYQLLRPHGEIASLIRLGRGSAAVAFTTAEAAQSALTLHGHWAKPPARPGISVSHWARNRPFPTSGAGEEFIGSPAHLRMPSASQPQVQGQARASTPPRPRPSSSRLAGRLGAPRGPRQARQPAAAAFQAAAEAAAIVAEAAQSPEAAPARAPQAAAQAAAEATGTDQAPVPAHLRSQSSPPPASLGPRLDTPPTGAAPTRPKAVGPAASAAAAQSSPAAPEGATKPAVKETVPAAATEQRPPPAAAVTGRDNTGGRPSQSNDDVETAALLNTLDALNNAPASLSPAALEGAGGGDRIEPAQDGSRPPPLSATQKRDIQRKYDFIQGIWRPGSKPLQQLLHTGGSATEVRNVPGDGNCQPAALIATGLTRYHTLPELKAAALQLLDAEPDRVRAALLANNVLHAITTWQEHLRTHLTTNGSEGDEVSLVIYALTVQRDIETLHAQDTSRLRLTLAETVINLADQRPSPIQIVLRPAGLPIYDANFRCIGRSEGHYSAIGPIRPPGNAQRSGQGRPM